MEDEARILRKAQQGDRDAFGLLYRHYYPRLYRYCKANIYRDDLAADICQETFLKSLESAADISLYGHRDLSGLCLPDRPEHDH